MAPINVPGAERRGIKPSARINIRMRMAIPVIVFLVIWLTGVLAGCLIVPFAGFPMPAALIPYIMLVFGILLVIIPNKIEAKKAREKLEELLT